MPKKTSVMTAIPYVNSTPHIGNILTTLSGDITARYLRLKGADVLFQAGTDENGLKIKEAAASAGQDVNLFVSNIAQRFIDVFEGMKISYSSFVRTSAPVHASAAREFFSRLMDAGHIYEGVYEGWYDVSTETYFKAEDLIDGKSPDGNEVRWVSERSFFFRLSEFQESLLGAYSSGALRVVPETRQNEVLSFVKQGLRDVCVSRTNPGWGITVPGHDDQVIYVWFDALINYLTACGWPNEGWKDMWPPVVQWLGKDILTRFHATLWPAMLMGAGLFDSTPERPFSVVAHGWILLGTEKISKSKGNSVEPMPLCADLAARAGLSQDMSVDALRWYLASTMSFENDSTFTYEDFDKTYNSDLANDLGNALNRALSMAHKFLGSDGQGARVPNAPVLSEALEAVERAKSECESAMQDFRIDRYADSAISLIRYLNKAIDTWAPWSLAKTQDQSLGSVLRSMLYCLRSAEALFRPLTPDTSDAIAKQLGCPPLIDWNMVGQADSLPEGTALSIPVPLFPRLETPTKPTQEKETKVDKPIQASEPPVTEIIEFPDFMKVKLRVARIIEAEKIEGSEKLMKLQVRIGEESRQIVAGIAKKYLPIDLIGRQVIVVANLKPAKLMGHESQGMLLAADDVDGSPILLQPESEAPEGTLVH